MFFTRTIRRKMASVLALVMLMLAVLAAGAFSGLTTLDDLVGELRFSLNKVPHWSDLSAAIARVNAAMSSQPSPLGAPKAPVAEALRLADEEVNKFYQRLQELKEPQARDWKRIAEGLLPGIGQRLKTARVIVANNAGETIEPFTRQLIWQQVGPALTQTIEAPEYGGGYETVLKRADKAHDRGRTVVVAATATVSVLLCCLVGYSYRFVFQPLRRLHQGALRVAHGDFDYRLHLRCGDEMAELAEAFNEMTARFQEITCDLDRQVRERSTQLVRSERLAGIGFLAAGVAHEINNPLSAIAMAAESLCNQDDASGQEPQTEDAKIARQYLEMIQREAFRCQQITRKLLDFARGEDATRSRNSLTDLVNEVIAMVRPMSKYADRLIDFPRTEPCYVEVNGPEIKQVILNIVSNALESMWPGGTLHIGFEEQTDHVVLTFCDDGCGMTSEVLDHLFEPFYTRRQDGKGTGLGMSISHRIVSDHGGSIEPHSEGPGCGSTFRVRIPRRATKARIAA